MNSLDATYTGTCHACGSPVTARRYYCTNEPCQVEKRERNLARHRMRNRSYYNRNRERLRASDRAKVIGQRAARIMRGELPADVIAQQREERARDLALATGVVPSTNQLAELLGISRPGARLVRRRAFGLKRQRPGGNQPVIPFPVPTEYLEAVGNG